MQENAVVVVRCEQNPDQTQRRVCLSIRVHGGIVRSLRNIDADIIIVIVIIIVKTIEREEEEKLYKVP